MTEPDAAARLRNTFEAAAAALEDLEYLRDVVSKNAPSSGEVRRITTILRRLLIDGTLVTIAGPRVGRLSIAAPDLKPFVQSSRSTPFMFFFAGPVQIFGMTMMLFATDRPPIARPELAKVGHTNFETLIDMKLESYLKQQVICLEGQWFDRRSLLKYVANIAHGVHSGAPSTEQERLIRRLRYVARARLVQEPNPHDPGNEDIFEFDLNLDAFNVVELPLDIGRSSVDVVLLEIWAMAQQLAGAPDINKLEALIRAEMGI